MFRDGLTRGRSLHYIIRKVAALVGAVIIPMTMTAESLKSKPTFVFLCPATSSFWNTATNNTMTVPINYPAGATKNATLEISGLGYSMSYENLTDDTFTFTLPAATSPETENVYDLTLTFDEGTVRTAKLGLIQGLSPGARGMTRCLIPQTAKAWQKVNGRAVLPIPYGTTSLAVKVNGGEKIVEQFDGAQGWYGIGGLSYGNNMSLELSVDGVQDPLLATLLGGPAGLMLLFR